jgi:membrane-associated HD superfamily phosphohydrolase
VVLALTVVIIIGIPGIQTGDETLRVGEAATADIVAPQSITYVSLIQTNAAREAAAAAVADVYDPADSRVTRQQVARLQQVMDYVTSVRGDAFASREQKLADLAAVADFAIDEPLGSALLDLSDSDWSAVRSETASVIERVMSDRVREDRVEDARNQIPALVSVSLPEEQAEIVVQLSEPFIAANSFFNEAATASARQAARDAVSPISQSFVQGQTVVARGRVISDADIEAMTALGLVQPGLSFQNTASSLITIVVAFAIFGLFIGRFNPSFFTAPRLMIFVSLLFILFLFIARITVPNRAVLPMPSRQPPYPCSLPQPSGQTSPLRLPLSLVSSLAS